MIKRNPPSTETPADQVPIEGPPPIMETIQMREIDFTFSGPVVFSVSLSPEDTLVEDMDTGFIITFKANGEVVTLNPDHLLYMSIRPRTIQRKVKAHGK